MMIQTHCIVSNVFFVFILSLIYSNIDLCHSSNWWHKMQFIQQMCSTDADNKTLPSLSPPRLQTSHHQSGTCRFKRVSKMCDGKQITHTTSYILRSKKKKNVIPTYPLTFFGQKFSYHCIDICEILELNSTIHFIDHKHINALEQWTGKLIIVNHPKSAFSTI